jgi:hypothetical protein
MKSIEFNTLMNATLLKHNGQTFYQISATGNFLPLEDDVRNFGSTSFSFIGTYSKFLNGVLVGISDATPKKDIVTSDHSGLNDIEALRVVDFKWKSDEERIEG